MKNDDLISRAALIEGLQKGTIITDDIYGLGIMSGVDYAIGLVNDAPSVDAVEIVRCKDCKYYQKTQACRYHSEQEVPFGFNVFMLPDDFCSYGEQKENIQ